MSFGPERDHPPELSERLGVLTRGARLFLRNHQDKRAVFYVGSYIATTLDYQPKDIDAYFGGGFFFLPYLLEYELNSSLEESAGNVSLPSAQILGTVNPDTLVNGKATYKWEWSIGRTDYGLCVISLYEIQYIPPQAGVMEDIRIQVG